MKRLAGPVLALAALMAGGAAQAQETAGDNPSAPIVVEGQRDRESQIRELIEALPPTSVGGHLSRFEAGACPAVLGVSPRQRALAAERMRAVAAATGVPLAGAKCLVNVLVIVTPDKKQLIEQLAKRYPSYFGELSSWRISALARSPGPAALWHRDELFDADGRPLFAAGTEDIVQQKTSRSSSRLFDLAHPAYTGSILVVESGALDGLTTTQLADYAAMRAFTGADPGRLPDGKVSTILTVLETPMGGQVPITLTAWDLAFLKSLYESDPNRYAPGQRGEIRAGMKKALDAASGGAGG